MHSIISIYIYIYIYFFRFCFKEILYIYIYISVCPNSYPPNWGFFCIYIYIYKFYPVICAGGTDPQCATFLHQGRAHTKGCWPWMPHSMTHGRPRPGKAGLSRGWLPGTLLHITNIMALCLKCTNGGSLWRACVCVRVV